ncbi:MAG: hypothetical protein IH949_09155 [Bacteroidetes bacterium]|nr:hypothetical protein [Bacteroidota bacterium]
MKEIDSSNLTMWKESTGRFRFQTTDSKIARQMRGRKNFHLTTISTTHKFWIYHCDLHSVSAAKSRFKGLTCRKPIYDSTEEIYY